MFIIIFSYPYWTAAITKKYFWYQILEVPFVPRFFIVYRRTILQQEVPISALRYGNKSPMEGLYILYRLHICMYRVFSPWPAVPVYWHWFIGLLKLFLPVLQRVRCLFSPSPPPILSLIYGTHSLVLYSRSPSCVSDVRTASSWLIF
jgi:hypothetical protein